MEKYLAFYFRKSILNIKVIYILDTVLYFDLNTIVYLKILLKHILCIFNKRLFFSL